MQEISAPKMREILVILTKPEVGKTNLVNLRLSRLGTRLSLLLLLLLFLFFVLVVLVVVVVADIQ